MSEAPQLLAEITDQQFALWRHHPVSAVVLQYLDDLSAAIAKDMLARWQTGALSLVHEQEVRGRMVAYAELASIDAARLREFYGVAAKP